VSEAGKSESLVGLVQAGRLDELEKRWQAEAAQSASAKPEMVAALDALLSLGQGSVAEILAAGWLEAQTARPGDWTDAVAGGVLQIAREVLSRIDSADFRKTAEALYRRAFARVPHVEGALKASGLVPAGAEARKVHPKKALRLLDTVLNLTPGAFLVRRGEDRAAETVSIDAGTGVVTVKSPRGAEAVSPGDAADFWEPVGPEDFRVLEQLRPARLAELAKADPGAVALSFLQSRGGRTDSGQLKKVLCPRHISASDYDGWWTRARNALRRDPNVRLEGRNPVLMVYDAAGRTPAQEVQAAFAAAAALEAKWEIACRFARDAAARKDAADAALAEKLRGTVVDQLAGRLARSGDDLASALLMDRVQAESGGPAAGCAVKLLRAAADPVALITALASDSAWGPALEALAQALPDKRDELLLRLLPAAPAAVADAAAEKLLAAGARDRVQELINRIFHRPTDSVPGLVWLWKGPAVADRLDMPAPVNLLTRMLQTLDALAAQDSRSEAVKDAKNLLKSALAARDAEKFSRVLEALDAGLALVVRRQVERCDALGPALRDDLIGKLRTSFPAMFRVAKVVPWEDPNVIWTTEAGLARRKAEYDDLVNVKIPANVRAIGAAREHGDLRENADYQAAMEERDLLRARQAEIQRDLQSARVLAPEDVPLDKVGIGSRVTLRNLGDGVGHQVTLLGPWDTDPERHIYAYKVPMYKPLLGARPGDTVELSLFGNRAVFRIEKTERGV
jgi:transcription elongation GreA/GreB family factor